MADVDRLEHALEFVTSHDLMSFFRIELGLLNGSMRQWMAGKICGKSERLPSSIEMRQPTTPLTNEGRKS